MKKRFNIGILTVFFFFIPWILSAQKVTVSVRNVPISRAITEIQKVSGYSIVVKSEGLDLQRIVSLSLENEDIESLLTKLFEGQSIDISINGHNIYVSRKVQALPPPPADSEMVRGTILDENGEPLISAAVTASSGSMPLWLQ